MKYLNRITISLFVLIFSFQLFSQRKLAEFSFDNHDKAINIVAAIGLSGIEMKAASSAVVLQAPIVMTDTMPDVDVSSLFFQFNASYSLVNNNIHFALAPKQGNNVKITHIEFRVRFGSLNVGNGGIFISKDSAMAINTQLWTCGSNKTFNTYKDFVVSVPDNNLSYSESTTDSIRFVIGHGTNALGMYFDNFVIFGIVNGESNPIQNISVNTALATKDLVNHPSGANSCWLMDSDIKWPRSVSNESRFGEMKLGALRYPYGHLADNYLWHTPGEYSTVSLTGPKPSVATQSLPAKWTWAVNQTNGSFLKDLGFDEFVAMCKRQNIEPLIVINAQSHTYAGGQSYEVLKTSAAEWVRYANITKGYGIKNWQIGNEVEHGSTFSMSDYTNLFIDFATAMKAIDPTIKVGTGVLSTVSWNKDVLTNAGTLCGFVSTHNYQYGSAAAEGGYRSWYKDNSITVGNSVATQTMLTASFSNRPELEIHITETNVTGGDFPDMTNIDIYKALYWFEMDMNQLALKNVKYTYYWGSHNPWNGETNLGDIAALLENSNANTIRPAGRIIQLINTYLKDKWINTTRVNGSLRCYASISKNSKELSIFILNKNMYKETANLKLSNFNLVNSSVKKVTFGGTTPYDTNPIITESDANGDDLTAIALPPISLTILNFKDSIISNVNPIDLNPRIRLLFDGKNKLYFVMEDFVIDSKLELYDVNGRVLMSKIVLGNSGSVNLSQLRKGVYIAKLKSSSGIKSLKLIL